MAIRRLTCSCGVKHWTTNSGEVQIKCRCGNLIKFVGIHESIAPSNLVLAPELRIALF